MRQYLRLLAEMHKLIGTASQVNITVNATVEDAKAMPRQEIALRAQSYLRQHNKLYPLEALYVEKSIDAEFQIIQGDGVGGG